MAKSSDALKIFSSGNPINNLIGIAAIAGLGWFIYHEIKKNDEKNKKNEADDNAASGDVPTQQAIKLRGAFNPSGTAWLIGADGTDNAAVMAIAKQIKDFKAVAKAYNAKYNTSLQDDLQSELSSSELQKFYDAVGSSNGAPTKKYGEGSTSKKWQDWFEANKNKYLVIRSVDNANIRSGAGLSFNIIKTIKKGEQAGILKDIVIYTSSTGAFTGAWAKILLPNGKYGYTTAANI